MIDGLIQVETAFLSVEPSVHVNLEVEHTKKALEQARASVQAQLQTRYPATTLRDLLLYSSSNASDYRNTLKSLSQQVGVLNAIQWFLILNPSGALDLQFSLQSTTLSSQQSFMSMHLQPGNTLDIPCTQNAFSVVTSKVSTLPTVRLGPNMNTTLHDLYHLSGTVLTFGCCVNSFLKNRQAAQTMIASALTAHIPPYSPSAGHSTIATQTPTKRSNNTQATPSFASTTANEIWTTNLWTYVGQLLTRAESIAPLESRLKVTGINQPLDHDIIKIFEHAKNSDSMNSAPITWGSYI